jgi:outer membrane protein assembly factor BamB
MRTSLLPVILVTFLSGSLIGSDWPRFRGPDGTGVSADRGLPVELNPEKNLLWKVPIPAGNSSPVIVNHRLFVTAHDGDDRFILCRNSITGEEIWRQKIQKLRTESFHPRNGPTTPTPVTDGKIVFSFFPDFGLIAHDWNGKELWRVPLGPFASVQGVAASPLYVNRKVVLFIDTPEEAYLSAYDSATGKLLWKTDREPGVLGSYSTPTSLTLKNGPPQIIVAGAIELTGYDSSTGKRIWWARGISHFPAAPPFVVGDSVYTVEPGGMSWPPFTEPLRLFDKNEDGKIEFAEMTEEHVAWTRSLKGIDRNIGNRDQVVTAEEYSQTSYEGNAGGLARTRVQGTGNVSKSNVLWRNTKGMPFLTGALLYKNVIYVIDDGIFTAFNSETGQALRKERVDSGEYYASPIAGDDKIYLVNLKGKVTILKAGIDWKILASTDLGDEVIATPAIADQRIYIRTTKSLFCFGSKR